MALNITTHFEVEEPKKHSVKFAENQKDGQPLTFTSVYLKNDALKLIGNPKKIKVVITAVE